MTMFTRLGDAFESVATSDHESEALLGFYAQVRGAADGRSTPAFSSYLRRRARVRRNSL